MRRTLCLVDQIYETFYGERVLFSVFCWERSEAVFLMTLCGRFFFPTKSQNGNVLSNLGWDVNALTLKDVAVEQGGL